MKLLRGSLPWKELEPTDALRSKLEWSGTALCDGYPPVFSEFVDYARALKYDEAPDYARWKHDLRALLPVDMPEDAVHDPEDSGGPRVGKPGTSDVRAQVASLG